MKRRSFLSFPVLAQAASGQAAFGQAPRPKTIDCHAHLAHHSRSSWREDDAKLIEAAGKLGIDQLCCSILTPARPSTPAMFRECNQWAWEAAKRFPGQILPYCYVNPGYSKEATEEIRRCVTERGFIGVKLYNEYRAEEPVLHAIAETCIDLGVPILYHAGHTMWLSAAQPRISDGSHIAELARKYPEAMLICAHISGGGDWQWTIKSLRHAPTVYLDLSGSVTDEGIIEMAYRTLGPERLLFGCDQSMTASVGRIRSADIPDAGRERILGANMAAILAKRGKA